MGFLSEIFSIVFYRSKEVDDFLSRFSFPYFTYL